MRESVSEDEEGRFQNELQRALEASRAEAKRSRPADPSSKQSSEHASTGPSLLSERAQMEKARIERVKRFRRDAGLNLVGKDEEVQRAQPPSKRQCLSSSSGVCANDKNCLPSSSASSGNASASYVAPNIPTIDQMFWNGEMRQTAVKHAEPRQDGKPNFRLTDLLGKVLVHFCGLHVNNMFLRNRICRSPYCPLTPSCFRGFMSSLTAQFL